MGEVEEIASVVLFLVGDPASLMTGSVVVVDGGYSLLVGVVARVVGRTAPHALQLRVS
jgi:NAD(P)-dependent dehydrogenase (short-subunit alcohol dehydrogenase family)